MISSFLSMLAALVLLASCGSGEAPSDEPSDEQPQVEQPAGEAQIFEGVGTVEAVDEERETITIAHEEIPGFMAAMTMTFDVAYTSLLDEIEPGDRVKFRIVVSADGSYFIEDIEEN